MKYGVTDTLSLYLYGSHMALAISIEPIRDELFSPSKKSKIVSKGMARSLQPHTPLCRLTYRKLKKREIY